MSFWKIIAASMQLLFSLTCVSVNPYCAFGSACLPAHGANYVDIQVDFL